MGANAQHIFSVSALALKPKYSQTPETRTSEMNIAPDNHLRSLDLF